METVWRNQDRPPGKADHASRFPDLQALGPAGEAASTFRLPREQTAALSPGDHISALRCTYLGTRLPASFVPACPMCSTCCQMQGKGCVPKSIPVGFECPVHGAYSWGVYAELCCTLRNFPKPVIILLDLGIGLGQPFPSSQLL